MGDVREKRPAPPLSASPPNPPRVPPMKFRPSPRTLLSSLLCMGLLTSAAPAANPLKAIGSSIKKVGSALTPWKKKEAPESPAPVAKPAAPKPAASSKPATAKTAKTANKKTVASKSTPKTRKSSSADATETRATPKRKGASGTTSEVAAGNSKTGSKTKPGEDSAGDVKETPADASSPSDATTAAAETKPVQPRIPLADLPFGTPVMGKRGYVRSPYAEDQGMVDVTDIPAGTKVKCPFSGKIFRVP
ncbi:MAG: hypothetical protein JWL81_73 [Verrucomicrobiales bacterium]|nr:hypothetical protein [Verrucomicrobiales bacterium]